MHNQAWTTTLNSSWLGKRRYTIVNVPSFPYPWDDWKAKIGNAKEFDVNAIPVRF